MKAELAMQLEGKKQEHALAMKPPEPVKEPQAPPVFHLHTAPGKKRTTIMPHPSGKGFIAETETA